ncbi:MAG: NADH-quinone oxidoreductase subunit J [SAR202 cluster bacterium]|nr:NADH-quinone oxidoreductase subunit J [SAR202 cluster bacterium]|tara:strand:- start:610 stop:1158 length:549 start_codon:yes stop_codon:yes gene_type:complete
MIGQGTEASLVVDIVFWVLAVSSIVAAIAVVQMKDLFRAALFLIVCLLAVAGMFVLLRAEFLAAVQVLIYVGAISVLIIFAILMTGDIEEGSPSHNFKWPVAALAALFCALAIFVSTSTDWNLLEPAIDAGRISADTVTDVYTNTVPVIAHLLIRDFVLVFEIASVLLLAAVIGALALIRER